MTKELQLCSYREFLCKYLQKKFTNAKKEDIEDAVQSALIKASKSLTKWKGDSSLKTWITVIAVNMYRDSFRKPYVKNEYVLDSADDLFLFDQIATEDFSETLCDEDYHKHLTQDLLASFENDVHIETFLLSVFDEIDYKDIAIKLNVPMGTVKSRVFRAKKLLRDKYREISSNYEI